MSKIMAQAKRYIADHPESDVAPLLEKLLKIAERDNIGSYIQQAINRGSDVRSFLNGIIEALSESHLCASCQQRVHSTIIEESDVEIF